jgi:hypothetical protein
MLWDRISWNYKETYRFFDIDALTGADICTSRRLVPVEKL